MRLIYEPTVIAAWSALPDDDTILDEYDLAWRPEEWGSTQSIPEYAGRICYQSFGKPRPGGNKAYMERILSEGHGSVLEHATVGFIIHGVSRSLTHELIRHRAGMAYSELSQRYVDASDLGFVVPPKYFTVVRPYGTAIGLIPRDFTRSVSAAIDAYKSMSSVPDSTTTLERKRIREAARSVLPNCTETHIAVTGNLRAWRNFLEQRGSIHADLEIRRLAVAVARKLIDHAPNVFQDAEIFMDEDGRESVRTKWRKV